MGIELLEYLAPRGGRTAPADVRPNDLFSTRLVLSAASVAEVERAAKSNGGTTVPVPPAEHRALVRDRDGHTLIVQESP